MFEPDILKSHDTLKIWSRGSENEKGVAHDALFVTLGRLVEIHDDPKIAKDDRVLLTNYRVPFLSRQSYLNHTIMHRHQSYPKPSLIIILLIQNHTLLPLDPHDDENYQAHSSPTSKTK